MNFAFNRPVGASADVNELVSNTPLSLGQCCMYEGLRDFDIFNFRYQLLSNTVFLLCIGIYCSTPSGRR